MKKSLTASLVLVLLLSLAACGGSDGDGDGEDVPHSGINPVRCDVAPSHCS